MTTTINWPRFLIVSIVGAILMLVLYGLWTGDVVAGMNLAPGYPSRPPEAVKPLLPFLSVVSIAQLVVFCFLYMRIYPQRTLSNALWWGAWGGFFMVLPDGQFFVGTPNQTWSNLFMGWADGIVTAMLVMAFFQLVYRPKDENWTQPKVEWPRFLLLGIASALLVFGLDLPFHMFLAPKIFTEYPAHDFPQRPPEESAKLMWFLLLTYLFQLSFFCYTFLRVYPRRGMGSAIWYGAWLGVWVVIPNMQFFVGLDKYTWHMLAIQIPEGAILTMIMMAFFEWAYRPKAGVATLAAAE
jgi:hypothetical protein